MDNVKEKVVVITGGTSGIGLGIAKVFSAAGATVIITYNSGRHLSDAVAYFRERPQLDVHPMKVDVVDRLAMSRAADEIEDKFGNIHILCNNAGVGVLSKVLDATYDDWDWSISVNIGGAINGVKSFLPKIRRHGGQGHIVSTASMGGIFLGGSAGVYNTTKYAIVGMMESLKAELSDSNIGVSIYCPGLVNTNIHETEIGRPQRYMDTNSRMTAAQLISFKNEVLSAGMDPVEAGQAVLEGVLKSDLYIFSHPEFYLGAKERFDAILTALMGDLSGVSAARIKAEAMTLRNPLYRAELDRKTRIS